MFRKASLELQEDVQEMHAVRTGNREAGDALVALSDPYKLPLGEFVSTPSPAEPRRKLREEGCVAQRGAFCRGGVSSFYRNRLLSEHTLQAWPFHLPFVSPHRPVGVKAQTLSLQYVMVWGSRAVSRGWLASGNLHPSVASPWSTHGPRKTSLAEMLPLAGTVFCSGN